MSEVLDANWRPSPSEARSLSATLISRLDLLASRFDGPLGWDGPDPLTSYSAELSHLSDDDATQLLFYSLIKGFSVPSFNTTQPLGHLWGLTQSTVAVEARQVTLNHYLITPHTVLTAVAQGPVIDFENDNEIEAVFNQLDEALKRPQPAAWGDYFHLNDVLNYLEPATNRPS